MKLGDLRNTNEAGFTLIELLVALAITGLLAAMILSGLASSGRYITTTSARYADDNDIIDTQRMLRKRLEQLRATTRLDSSTPTVDAQGDEASFSFVAPPLERAEPEALWRYRLMSSAAGNLILYHASTLDRRYDFGAPGTKGWTPIRLLDNVASMRIAYYGRDPVATGRRWQTRWFRRPQPPDLVRVSVKFRDGDRRAWPDLVVRPRATINTACKIDTLTGRCEFES